MVSKDHTPVHAAHNTSIHLSLQKESTKSIMTIYLRIQAVSAGNNIDILNMARESDPQQDERLHITLNETFNMLQATSSTMVLCLFYPITNARPQ